LNPECLVLLREKIRALLLEKPVLPREYREGLVLPRKQARIVLTEAIKVSEEVVPRAVESKILVSNDDVTIVIPLMAKRIATAMHIALQARGVIETRLLIDGHVMIETDVVTGQNLPGKVDPSSKQEMLSTVVSEAVIKICVRLPGQLPDCALADKVKSNEAQCMRRNIQIPHPESVSRGAVEERLIAVSEINTEAVDIFCQEVEGTHTEHKQDASESSVGGK